MSTEQKALPVVAWIEHHKGGDNLIWDPQKSSPRCTPLTPHAEAKAEIERLTAEVSRLRDDRNCEKRMRKDAEERAHNAEAERDAANAAIGRLTYERDEAIAVSRRAYNETGALTERTRKAEAERDAAVKDAAKHLRLQVEFSWYIHNYCLAMSAAVIEAEIGGGPAEGMRWIENTLIGPGLYPDLEEARELGGAQAWFDAKMAEGDAQRKAAALAATGSRS